MDEDLPETPPYCHRCVRKKTRFKRVNTKNYTYQCITQSCPRRVEMMQVAFWEIEV